MVDKRKMKKLLILNLPYFLVGLFAMNLGEAWGLAEGADSSAKILQGQKSGYESADWTFVLC